MVSRGGVKWWCHGVVSRGGVTRWCHGVVSRGGVTGPCLSNGFHWHRQSSDQLALDISAGYGVISAVGPVIARPLLSGPEADHLDNNNREWAGHGCDMAVATRAFFDMMAESQTTTAMLFGDACYNVTGPMVQIAHQWDMFQLSYGDTNPMLSNRDEYPNFYRTVPSDSDFNPARLALLRAFNWSTLSYGDTNPMLSNRDEYPNFYRTVPSDSDFNPARLALLRAFNWSTVGTLFQDAKLGEGRHGYAHNRFDSLMTKQKINVSVVQSFSDDPTPAVAKLKEHDIRIIVGNFDQDMARRVFCRAHHHGMFGAKYQWIILGTYEPDWWRMSDSSIDCTPEQLNKTLHGYLATDVLTLSTSEEVTESGKTPREYLALYEAARGSEYSKYHGYAYDGVWVVAKALDRLLDDVSVSPEDFRGPLVGKVLNETAFVGVTGRVQFLNGDRVGSTTILQMQYGTMVKVGEYHALTDHLDLSVGDPILWIDGNQPADRSIKIEELRRVSFPVYVGFVVMAALGITMAAFFLALNIRFRRHSPNMNNLIIVGSMLCYLSVILLGAEPGSNNRQLFSYWCTARSWTLALGFTLAFGAMFGKTWRVHAIFTNIKLNKKVIKDYKLMLIVLVLVLVDASILVTWQIVDPFDKAVKRMSPEVSLAVYEDFEIIPKIDYCSSRYMELWLGALYAYKGLLLAFGCFLAWETRHVSIPALNDSQYIGMSVYNVVIMCVSGAAVSFIIKDMPTQSFVIIGLFIVFCTTITLCLVFLPKIIQLKRNPKGDESRVRATLRQSAKKTTKFEFAAQRERMKATSEENRRLRGCLEQKAVELEHLLEQLGDEACGKDLTLRSSFLRSKILALTSVGDSPGKLSVRSYNQSDLECLSTYSEASAATSTMLMADDWSPGPGLFKHRGRGSRAGAEAIELAGVRLLNRKQSITIPPPAEEELSQDDPFGGVYLGPEEKSAETSASDQQFHPRPATPDPGHVIAELSPQDLTTGSLGQDKSPGDPLSDPINCRHELRARSCDLPPLTPFVPLNLSPERSKPLFDPRGIFGGGCECAIPAATASSSAHTTRYSEFKAQLRGKRYRFNFDSSDSKNV
ncbi:hypothetical protein EGW08_010568 [Elysia chlorotica]|uniref:Gamma-aminobutyric acid type B receptor subunit 2 n=1 Tax=Elysia chlorotica TaxID=188477 RepID=A0A3S1BDS3_ELYCH|nr:hypothetical protein EGW08_010568 [Elysia chlorotica]